MATCTIKGKEYQIGDVAGSKENFVIIGDLIGDFEKVMSFLPEAHRVLEESLRAGNSPEEAERALADLTIKIKPGSDFVNALIALSKSVLE